MPERQGTSSQAYRLHLILLGMLESITILLLQGLQVESMEVLAVKTSQSLGTTIQATSMQHMIHILRATVFLHKESSQKRKRLNLRRYCLMRRRPRRRKRRRTIHLIQMLRALPQTVMTMTRMRPRSKRMPKLNSMGCSRFQRQVEFLRVLSRISRKQEVTSLI